MFSSRHLLGALVLSVCVLLSCGCSRSIAKNPAPALESASEALVTSEDLPTLPFQLRVQRELNDGSHLYIAGELISKTAWDADRTLLRLTVMSQGEPGAEIYFPCDDRLFDAKLDQQLGRAGRFPFVASAPVTGASDYQLEVLWGAEAERFLINTGRGGAVRLRNVQVALESCPEAGCQSPFRVTAELFNAGRSAISSVMIGVGFVPRTEAGQVDFGAIVPQSEEQIELKQLNLAAGATRALRLNIEQPMSLEQRASLRPALRVISYDN